jgi:hypothetical protein
MIQGYGYHIRSALARVDSDVSILGQAVSSNSQAQLVRPLGRHGAKLVERLLQPCNRRFQPLRIELGLEARKLVAK